MIDHDRYNKDDDIVALATAMAESAVAMVRTSGPSAIKKLEKLFVSSSPLSAVKHRQAVFGRLVNPVDGSVLDEVVALVYHSPGGYTGENAVELMCHGSLPGLEMIIKLLIENGFRGASPGEFTFRAFMNGKLDLTQAEAVNELIHSRSQASHEMALSRLSGSLSSQIDIAKNLLITACGAIEIQLDYPGDEVDDELHLPIDEVENAKKVLDSLIESYSVGKLYRDGVRVALCGKTNSGKSSLFNLFLKEDRSIVSDIHGTTRDYLESWISLKGIPVRLFDTAGLRDTVDPIEAEGIKRAGVVINSADFIVYVVDSQLGLDASDELFLKQRSSPAVDLSENQQDNGKSKLLLLWNKTDISNKPAPEGFLPLSSVTGEGFSAVEKWLLSRLSLKGSQQEAVIDSQRQHRLLQAASDSLAIVVSHFNAQDESELVLDGVAMDLREALDSLGQLTGEVSTSDILQQMFSDFCVGK